MGTSRPDKGRVALREATTLQFVFKVASRCNLNCSYCYVYNKGDSTWKERPAFMPDEVFDAALERIGQWCAARGQTRADILFHGGEPLLAGHERFDDWCRRVRRAQRGVSISLSLQTNGTLIDEGWARLFAEHRIRVGVSLDGPPDLNDRLRIDHAGRGSYGEIRRGVECLRAAGLPVSFLCVVTPGEDGARAHRHLADLGANRINYLLPDHTNDSIGAVRRRFGATPAADFLVAAFDCWWNDGTLATVVEPFISITQLVMGGESALDMFGNRPFGFVFVEADGAIEGLDVLRICSNGTAATALNVLRNGFGDLMAASELHRKAIFTGMPLPGGCLGCAEETTCAGGYLPHRWSRAAMFDNPSAWCADILELFAHIRRRLEVDYEDTARRRRALNDLREASGRADG